jgi:hypothetical protein
MRIPNVAGAALCTFAMLLKCSSLPRAQLARRNSRTSLQAAIREAGFTSFYDENGVASTTFFISHTVEQIRMHEYA